MVLIGTLVNGAAILVGSLIGLMLKKIPERMKTIVMQALGLAIVILGISMALEGEQFLITVGCLVIGAILGEWWQIEQRLNDAGDWIEQKVGPKGGESQFAKGFVTASLVYVVGAMAVLGALDSGLRLDHSLLYTKAMLDGFTAVLFSSIFGIGVLFSLVPVVLYQGGIALLAGQIDRVVPAEMLDHFILEMTAVGGIMIIAIGLRILGLLHIKVANLLPALPIVFLCVAVIHYV
ncbi:DUF554 domain-containing protein [Geomicrobium sediminis]|uniref:Membrane protein YqgA involved in biofilm formation n=1 Tax=Geomicrobium sediminis TaxID=1347788 RepID=A0ABS2PGE5_9BACL|nr:DUF554 domain-containing protein [Geomicrobium sediminis]MBM7634515.1 putative membrane protein YqgA involved in biofilm formation [Geomicrobium sediminis]